MIIQLLFWIALVLVFYTFLGYGLVLYLLVRIRRLFRGKRVPDPMKDLPLVTLLVAAYNEEDFILEKIKNTLNLDYPPEKIQWLFVADGSDDRTVELIRQHPEIELLFQPERKGKIAAVDRAMEYATGEFIVFCDANTELNDQAIKRLISHYADPKVGAVAGEKRINKLDKDQAAGAGEGFYWRYESFLKDKDAELYSVVGAAGELFSIRKSCFEKVPEDTIIEDFYMTLRINMRGYRVEYEPDAYAYESASASVKEELKRKIRIAAGGIQAILRLLPLLNFFKYGILSFQYVSHRVLRWTLTPLLLPVLFILNILLLDQGWVYQVMMSGQILFYALALLGFYFESHSIKVKVLFIPYYFCMMNYAVFAGWLRYARGKQSVLWERAKRA